MRIFIKKWEGNTIEDWGIYCSQEFKTFTRDFKTALKRNFKDCVIAGFKANHYDFDGFVSKGEKCVYISYHWKRYGVFDPNEDNAFNGILYRYAESTNDWYGGRNHFCNFYHIVSEVRKMLEN